MSWLQRAKTPVALGWGVDLFWVLLCVWYATRLSLGMDVNYDQLNYHYYYPWLMFHGGIGQIDPEPFTNRYVSPLAQLPWYFFNAVLSPRMCAAAIAALASTNLMLVRRITMVAIADRATPLLRLALGVAATCLAAGGVVFKLMLGTSLSDVITAIPLLGAVLTLLYAARPGRSTKSLIWLMVLAGALAGVAFSAKLTTSPYVLGLTAATVVLAAIRRTPWPVVGLAIGGIAAVAVAGGWWFWEVGHATGNPVFPYYNNIFHSSLWGDNAFRDTRFGPRGIWDAMKFPYYMFHGTKRLLDYRIRDPRWLLLELTVAAVVVVLAVRWVRRGRAAAMPGLTSILLSVFFAVGSLAWLVQFGIARYAVTGELLTGVLFVLALMTLIRNPAAVVVVGIIAAVAMARFDIGRTNHVPFAADRYGVQASALEAIPAGSEVIADEYSGPSGFLLTFVPATSHRHIIQGWFYHSPLLAELKRDEISRAPRIYVIQRLNWFYGRPSAELRFERHVGVRIDPSTCVQIPNNAAPRQLCRASWVG
jgi:hypothetical protein